MMSQSAWFGPSPLFKVSWILFASFRGEGEADKLKKGGGYDGSF